MADAPWRCSQCGTVNAPSANSCRTCGRWPSLFELESGAVDTDTEQEPTWFPDEAPDGDEASYPQGARSAEEARYPEEAPFPDEAQRAEERRASAAPAEPDDSAPSGAPWPGPEPPIPDAPPGSSLRRFSRLIVPLLVLIYIVITAARNR